MILYKRNKNQKNETKFERLKIKEGWNWKRILILKTIQNEINSNKRNMD
jgi:hypothetical protein